MSTDIIAHQPNAVLQTKDVSEQRVDSRLIADKLEVEHHTVITTLDRYESEISKFGVVRFEIDKPLGSQGGRPVKFALLNEKQCHFIGSLSRNTEKVVEFKFWLVEQFHEAKQTVLAPKLTDDALILQAISVLQERVAKQAEQVAELQISNAVLAPKADYTDKVLTSASSWTTTVIASELGMSATALNRKLEALEVQYKRDDVWVLHAKHNDCGYTKTRTSTYTDSYGRTRTNILTVWTETGRNFVHSLLNKNLASAPVSST